MVIPKNQYLQFIQANHKRVGIKKTYIVSLNSK